MMLEHVHIILGGAILLALLVLMVYWHFRHQRLLKVRAHLMREAIICKDFSFRLPTKGLFFGERALQEALNDFSQALNTLSAQKEMESWQKLTRVLTHEIMNAATPICSISQAYLSDPNIKGSRYEEGIEAIYKTSLGMSDFVKNFRKITNIQEPSLAEVDLHDLVSSVKCLYGNLAWNITIDESLRIKADEGMLRLVLTNLAKNAQEAGAKAIDIRWNNGLYISNNGAPIPADVARDIFIPFFTTKSTGSGIGLSLSRQLMMKQGMNLTLAERPVAGYHTTFVISADSI